MSYSWSKRSHLGITSGSASNWLHFLYLHCNKYTNTHVVCLCALPSSSEATRFGLEELSTLGKLPEAHSRSLLHFTRAHWAMTPKLSSPNPFICSSPFNLPYIPSRHSLRLKETVMENRIRPLEDTWLHSFSLFESVHQFSLWTRRVSEPSPRRRCDRALGDWSALPEYRHTTSCCCNTIMQFD